LGNLKKNFGFRGVIDPAETDLATLVSNISANTKPYAKRVWPVNQGPIWVLLMKKTESQKSRDTLPLNPANQDGPF
jgi:hypothetical protein